MKTLLRTSNWPPPLVVAWLDDVLYPAAMYRAGACRTAAELLRMMFGVDTYARFEALYRPGYELEVVRQVIEESLAACDGKTLVKVAAAMESHDPQISPYQDAWETFPLLQTFGVQLALVGEGSRIGQRVVAERLRLHDIFQHMVYADPRIGRDGWCNAFVMLEAFAGLQRDNAIVICSNAERVQELASAGWVVVYLQRGREQIQEMEQMAPGRIFPVVNLYELPEALGLVAWGDEEEVESHL